MTGFPAFASVEPPPAATPGERILVCVPNWIGDAVMSMPAIQALHRARPDLDITLLCKPGVAPLWALLDGKRSHILLSSGYRGLAAAVRSARGRTFSRAYVMPHSVRSALVPRLAGIPLRIGTWGFLRRPLLSHVRTAPESSSRRHQAWEYMRLLGMDAPDASLSSPRLRVPDEARARAEDWLADLPVPRWGLLPGAARGPSKRWSAESFRTLAQRLTRDSGGSVVVMGSAAEQNLCHSVAEAAGVNGRNLAGKTDLAGWAALLQSCAVVIANDSGGMHMAAALGVPVTAIFGATDPEKTGPIGGRSTLLQAPGTRTSRDVDRQDPDAARALAAISPEQVYSACLFLLEGADSPPPGTEGAAPS